MNARVNIQIPIALHARLGRFVDRFRSQDPLGLATTTRTDVLARAAALGLDQLERQCDETAPTAGMSPAQERLNRAMPEEEAT